MSDLVINNQKEINMAVGQGNASSNAVQATRKGAFPDDNTGGDRSEGEVPGAGSIYAANIVERPNTSNNRNQGPTRAGSRVGSSTLPVQTQGSRNTGRKG